MSSLVRNILALLAGAVVVAVVVGRVRVHRRIGDVVDELRLLVYPLLLGRGKRLFDDGTQPAAFRLAATRTTPAGSASSPRTC